MAKLNHIPNYLPKETKYKNIFKKLSTYAYDHYSFLTKVGQKYQDVADIDFNIVRLKLREKNEEKMIFYFLHELGHVRLCFNTNYNKTFYAMLNDQNSRRYKTNAYKIGRLQEEILAWNEAFDLAKELKLKIDYNKMENEKNKCLKTYTKWAAK
jgi:hypothetical protein